MSSADADGEMLLGRVLAVKQDAAERLRTYPRVTGVGVGLKLIGGVRTDRVAIRVYVERKLPESELATADILPREIEGIPVDVIEARFHVHGAPSDIDEHRARHNPMIGGISIGNEVMGGSGTLGGSVFDRHTQQDLILSNWHVLCGSPVCQPGETIIQPGTGGGDTGTGADVVGLLHRFALTDEVDGAVAVLSGHRFLLRELLEQGSFAGMADPVLGGEVRKSGRTSGATSAVVTDVSAEVDVRGYPQGTLRFRNQIVIENTDPSLPGDSGSLWIDGASRVVGLNFAGSEGMGIANPITAVVAALDIDIDRGISMHHFLAATGSLWR
ncbi:hypothetical protein AB0I00_38960 [Streptomyces sp. NPDC050803]|uniref:hypothetical protein n=1 Tax=unclassified Streptomyces TaxID=2593676 RepID=UPI003422EF64